MSDVQRAAVGRGPRCIHKLTTWQLTGKVCASLEIELSDIHLLEYFDIPWVKQSGKWNVEMNAKLRCLKDYGVMCWSLTYD